MPYQPDSCLWEEEATVVLTVYHRLPRLRLAIPSAILRALELYANGRGYRLKRILIRGEEVYPRPRPIRGRVVVSRRLRDGRIVIPADLVEKLGLRPGVPYRLTFKFTPSRLYKVKIRLYNEQFISREGVLYPSGMFQGWFDILTALHFETGMPLLEEWWFSRLQIDACKIGFISFWKGTPFREAGHTYRGREGIAARAETPRYTPYHYDIPPEFIEKAETMTVEDVVWGISNVAPELYTDYSRDGAEKFIGKASEWDVIFQRAMIVLPDGTVKYDVAFGGWDKEKDRPFGQPLNYVLATRSWLPIEPVWYLTDRESERLREELDP